jgi:hypothetical protein
MTPNGSDVRYLYDTPSHHSWQDGRYVLDFGEHTAPGGASPLNGYFLFQDDGTGVAKELLWPTEFDGHNSYLPGPDGDWIISDTVFHQWLPISVSVSPADQTLRSSRETEIERACGRDLSY